ncbi:hypothetical protein AcW1_005073 [Taiwanofungus camphoratus]|nr:hypothetical protein AcW1_005073 [Antrodia cinnamomea]
MPMPSTTRLATHPTARLTAHPDRSPSLSVTFSVRFAHHSVKTTDVALAAHQEYAPVLSVILSESANDTLDDANCPNAGSADAQDAAWQAVYAPNITAALNAYAPGADLDDDDTGSLMSLCPFETVAKMGRSGFCGLFEQLGAFAGYEYAGDGGGGGVGC